jgi:hypothetical protein
VQKRFSAKSAALANKTSLTPTFLHQELGQLEVELLGDAWTDVRSWPDLEREQPADGPPTRAAGELAKVPERDLRSRDEWRTDDLVRVLRALTTNDPDEAVRLDSPEGSYAIRLERLP